MDREVRVCTSYELQLREGWLTTRCSVWRADVTDCEGEQWKKMFKRHGGGVRRAKGLGRAFFFAGEQAQRDAEAFEREWKKTAESAREGAERSVKSAGCVRSRY